MTPAEADQRIILSQQTLHKYIRMVFAGQYPVEDLGLMNDELDVLERLADDHPVQAEQIRALGEEWQALMVIMRAKLN